MNKKFRKVLGTIINRVTGNDLAQKENRVKGNINKSINMDSLLSRCGSEGIVLLKNNKNVLPFKKNDKVAVFGRCQYDFFYVGYGSGGDVHPTHRVNLIEGLKNNNININEELASIYQKWCLENVPDHGWWGNWPFCYEEMNVDNLPLKKISKNSDVALIIIGRAAGEDRENKLEKGSYYLTDEEENLLNKVTKNFKKTVVLLNSGNIIDLSWIKKYPIDGLLYVWQLGQESGNAIANILNGNMNPSGKLTDTIAVNYEDYPSCNTFGHKEFNEYKEDIFVGYRYFNTFKKDAILYPFGYGLSYTKFNIEVLSFKHDGSNTLVTVKVKNTGNVKGKEVVQLYVSSPKGLLSKPEKVLVAFNKTKLLKPNEEQILSFKISEYTYSSFDDLGLTKYPNSYVLESGKYRFYLGNSSIKNKECGFYNLKDILLVKKCNEACVLPYSFIRLSNGVDINTPTPKTSLKERVLDSLKDEIPYTGNKGILLQDVKDRKNTLDEFIAQLTIKDLSDLTHGHGPMGSKLGVSGNAGVFGGITKSLRKKGVPSIATSDGPSGLRINYHTNLLPCGTALACTWNERLLNEVFTNISKEMKAYGVNVLLSPGMNIHRNPLCGRNFEYLSEDPFLTGKIASAIVKGIQSENVSACPKHFACNNQEVRRSFNDSRVSPRALREIYLKGFEIVVKEAKPLNIMTSYNKINNVYAYYNFDLTTTILRHEWNYKGNVMTDWWTKKGEMKDFPKVKNNANRVRAQVDVLMPGRMKITQRSYAYDRQQVRGLNKKERLTKYELQRSAKNVLNFILNIM